ncbi:hypothetical protein DFJ74DRAFT_694984 [Hyaloraphidium curvatum]|nr:hypothetical protein DFJ74DRAFT_694984 [Hyaloraphidium curvatum]
MRMPRAGPPGKAWRRIGWRKRRSIVRTSSAAAARSVTREQRKRGDTRWSASESCAGSGSSASGSGSGSASWAKSGSAGTARRLKWPARRSMSAMSGGGPCTPYVSRNQLTILRRPASTASASTGGASGAPRRSNRSSTTGSSSSGWQRSAAPNAVPPGAPGEKTKRTPPLTATIQPARASADREAAHSARQARLSGGHIARAKMGGSSSAGSVASVATSRAAGTGARSAAGLEGPSAPSDAASPTPASRTSESILSKSAGEIATAAVDCPRWRPPASQPG